VARLDRHAEARELELAVHHVGEHALGDRPEVVVVELVPLRGLGAEERPARVDQVGALEVVLLVDQEVLLLGPDGREDARRGVVAEQPQRADRRARQRVHRPQQRDLRVERLTGPRRERRRDAEQRAVRVLQEERRARGVPGRVAACLEGRAHAAGRERGGIRLALDQLLARELGERDAVHRGGEERVVLLGREAGERLEDVGEVRGALLERPLLHGERDRVRQRRVECLALLEDLLEAPVGLLRQALALHRAREDVVAERVVRRLREVGLPERASIRAPLGGGDVVLASTRHVVSEPPGWFRARQS
jgi:hypothetical protein